MTGVDKGDVMTQQSVRQAARRSALDAQAVLRKERADRELRLERLAVEVLTALGERDQAIRDAEQRAGGALLAMTDGEGLSVREAVEWCGSSVTVREVPRLRRLARLGAAVYGKRAASVWAGLTPDGSKVPHELLPLLVPPECNGGEAAIDKDRFPKCSS